MDELEALRKENAEQRRQIARTSSKRRYERRKDEGACTRCGGPLLSEALCWDCLNELEVNRGIRL